MQNLIEAIETAKWDIQVQLRDLRLPIELAKMTDGLDRVFLLAPYSPREAKEVAGRVMTVLQYHTNCVSDVGDADLHKRLVRIGVAFCNEFNAWHDKARREENEGRRDWHDPTIKAACVGRWESRGGKYWVELHRGSFDYYFWSNNSSGSIGNPNMPEHGAVTVMQSMLDRGEFLPDKAKAPMRRVDVS
jgi:hypothetical protein